MVSKHMERECVVVFDEAHNIDNVCIEALSVALRQRTLDGAARNIASLSRAVDRSKAVDAGRLRDEYNRMVAGLQAQLPGGGTRPEDEWMANPVIPADVAAEALPGNIRRAEHFVAMLGRFLTFLRGRLEGREVRQEGPPSFCAACAAETGIDAKTLRFCYDRLSSLLKTLEISDQAGVRDFGPEARAGILGREPPALSQGTRADCFQHRPASLLPQEEYGPIGQLCDFATLLGTYPSGFAVIFEPFDERYPQARALSARPLSAGRGREPPLPAVFARSCRTRSCSWPAWTRRSP